jgi:hypothetical protein
MPPARLHGTYQRAAPSGVPYPIRHGEHLLKTMTTDEQALHDMVKHLESAWNASDSKAWTSQFADDATFIHIYGGQLDGRAAIEGSHRVLPLSR